MLVLAYYIMMAGISQKHQKAILKLNMRLCRGVIFNIDTFIVELLNEKNIISTSFFSLLHLNRSLWEASKFRVWTINYRIQGQNVRRRLERTLSQRSN